MVILVLRKYPLLMIWSVDAFCQRYFRDVVLIEPKPLLARGLKTHSDRDDKMREHKSIKKNIIRRFLASFLIINAIQLVLMLFTSFISETSF